MKKPNKLYKSSNPLGLEATNLKFTSRARSLPNTVDMRRQNGPVKVIKPAAKKDSN